MADRYGFVVCIVSQITFNLAWSPIPLPSKFQNQIHGGFWSPIEAVRDLRLDAQPLPPIFPMDAAPSINSLLGYAQRISDIFDFPAFLFLMDNPSSSTQNTIQSCPSQSFATIRLFHIEGHMLVASSDS